MITVQGRKLIIPKEERNIGTIADNHTTTRIFKLNRFSDGVDISTLNFKLDIEYTADDGSKIKNTAELDKRVSDHNIFLEWVLSKADLPGVGVIYIQIRGCDLGFLRFNTASASMFVDGIIGDYESYKGDLSELRFLEAKIGNLYDRFIQTARDVPIALQAFSGNEKAAVSDMITLDKELSRIELVANTDFRYPLTFWYTFYNLGYKNGVETGYAEDTTTFYEIGHFDSCAKGTVISADIKVKKYTKDEIESNEMLAEKGGIKIYVSPGYVSNGIVVDVGGVITGGIASTDFTATMYDLSTLGVPINDLLKSFSSSYSSEKIEEIVAEIYEKIQTESDRVEELKGDLDELNSEVFGEIIETDVTGEVLTGTIIDTRTGKESTNFPYSKCTGFIDVSDNANYYYTGKIYNYIGIAGYNSNDEFVTSVLSGTNEIFTNYKLTIPDGVAKIRASSHNPNATSINPLQVVKKAKTSNLVDEVSALNDEVSALNDEVSAINKNKENITIVNHIYVATTGSDTSGDGTSGNPFATIYHANESITDASEMNQYIIHVADGTYTDLQTRYAGVQTHENYEGIKCKPWVVYEGNVKHPENVVIQWDGKTGYGDEFNYNGHAVHFCPFHITGSNGWTVGHKEIRGFTFDCKNTRYALHVEMSGYGYGVTWKVSDCIFVWHGVPDCRDITYPIPTIGTGSGHYEKGHLLRCKIINDSGVTDGFRNHDSKWKYDSLLGNLPHIGAEIIIEDCVFNGGDSGDTNIIFRTINGNGLVDGYNRFSIINCVGINKLNYQLSGSSTECEWRANIKCSKIVTNQFLDEGLLQ